MKRTGYIVKSTGKTFNKFIGQITDGLSKPRRKFVTELLCGTVFSGDLVLTHIAAKIPQSASLAATAKRFRRQLANSQAFIRKILLNYLGVVRKRLDRDSLFITDLTDLARPYARRMENIALVRDGDKGGFVTGYWCMEVYARDKDGIVWPLILWPYSLQAEGQLSENVQILNILSILDEYFGQGFGIWIFDRGFDRLSLSKGLDRDREICGKKIPEYAGLDLPGLFGDGFFEFSSMAVQGYSSADKR